MLEVCYARVVIELAARHIGFGFCADGGGLK